MKDNAEFDSGILNDNAELGSKTEDDSVLRKTTKSTTQRYK